jgi:hypothetical protein
VENAVMDWTRFANPMPIRWHRARSPLVQLAIEHGAGSALIAQILDVEYNDDAPADVALEYDLDTVRAADVWEARNEIVEASQRSVAARLPARFTVWRGGHPAKGNQIIPVTTNRGVAKRHSTDYKHWEGVLYECELGATDVLADIDLFQRGFAEDELLVSKEVFLRQCKQVA